MERGSEGGQQQSPRGYEPTDGRRLKGKNGKTGEAEGGGDGFQSVTLSVLVTIPPYFSFFPHLLCLSFYQLCIK